MTALFWILGTAAALWLLDRGLLWMESRGWIYYRKAKPRGGAAVYHLLEMSSVFDPGIREVVEARVLEEREDEESGAPPA